MLTSRQIHTRSLLVASAAALLLSSCVKMRMTIRVAPDGSGTFGAAVGMTQEVQALLGAGGQDPASVITQAFYEKLVEQATDLEVRQWSEGEFEWVEVADRFDNLDELNQTLNGSELFERFSVTRERGLLKNRFVLAARMTPSFDVQGLPQEFLGFVDPSAVAEVGLAVHLPGKIVETNGVLNSETGAVEWSLAGGEPLEVRAVSEAWNWVSIGAGAAIAALFCAVALAFVALAVVLVLRRRRIALTG